MIHYTGLGLRFAKYSLSKNCVLECFISGNVELLAIFCFFSLSPIWSYEFIISRVIRKAHICLTVQQIFGNSTEGNAINLARKIPVFFVAKHYVIE